MLDQGVSRYLKDGRPVRHAGFAATASVERCDWLDVDEIACLVDFGVALEPTMSSLRLLDVLKRRSQVQPLPEEAVLAEGDAGMGDLLELVRGEGVTALRCAPSQARALAELPGARGALEGVRLWVLGGEARAAQGMDVSAIHLPRGAWSWSPLCLARPGRRTPKRPCTSGMPPAPRCPWGSWVSWLRVAPPFARLLE